MPNQIHTDFIASAIDAGGSLTPAQAAQLLEMGEGDTGALTPEPISVPAAEPAAVDPAPAPAAQDAAKTDTTPPDDQLTAENAVVMAKDGKHTINFEVLADTRERLREKSAQLELANQQLAELQAQAQARADAGQAPTQADTNAAAAQAAIDAGVDPALFGDFSPEAMAKGVAKMVQAQVAAQMAAIDAKLQPLQQQTAKSATEAHLSAIYTAHPDADSIVESQEFAAWRAEQPSIVQQALDRALTEGSTGQVIEVFDAFKKAGAAVSQPPAQTKADPAADAKAAINALKPTPPASLSDIPGGRPAGLSRQEQMAQMDPASLSEAMATMAPAEIDAYLNSLI